MSTPSSLTLMQSTAPLFFWSWYLSCPLVRHHCYSNVNTAIVLLLQKMCPCACRRRWCGFAFRNRTCLDRSESLSTRFVLTLFSLAILHRKNDISYCMYIVCVLMDACIQWQLVLFVIPSFALALYMIVTGMMGSWILFVGNIGALLFGLVPYG